MIYFLVLALAFRNPGNPLLKKVKVRSLRGQWDLTTCAGLFPCVVSGEWTVLELSTSLGSRDGYGVAAVEAGMECRQMG